MGILCRKKCLDIERVAGDENECPFTASISCHDHLRALLNVATAMAKLLACTLYLVDGLVQDCGIPGVLAMEILQSCTYTWIYYICSDNEHTKHE